MNISVDAAGNKNLIIDIPKKDKFCGKFILTLKLSVDAAGNKNLIIDVPKKWTVFVVKL